VCGRFTLKTLLGQWLAEVFGVQLPAEFSSLPPRHNIAPTQSIVVITSSAGNSRTLESVRWGLIPHWSKAQDQGPPLINARSETIDTKPSFRQAFRGHRCLVIADGYYEWQEISRQRKQAYWIHRPDERPFFMAGIFSQRSSSQGESAQKSAAIVTQASQGRLATIHDRMPVILDHPADIETWLGQDQLELDCFADFRKSLSDDFLSLRPVAPRVGKVSMDDPKCLEEVVVLRQRTLDID
jgi:putative SOS response-associated peptidase YedK